MPNDTPTLSIVIPSLNQAGFLPKTLDSLLKQQAPPPFEVIIVDGGSTDGTLDYLKTLTDPCITWTSEPDQGQTHAINKGLAEAQGEIVTWLNSDDVYLPDTLRLVANTFDTYLNKQWLVGRVSIVDQAGRELRCSVTRYKNRRLNRYRYRSLLRENFISQMGVFWRRSFGDEVGPLDESLHYTMDYDLWLRMGKRTNPLILDRELAKFRLHQGSKSGAVNRAQFDEQYAVACRYFDGDTTSKLIHRLYVEKIVWAYRLFKLLGR